MAEGQKGCFKYGCIGCLSVVAVVLGLLFLSAAISYTRGSQEPTPEERSAEHELPEPPSLGDLVNADRPADSIDVMPLPDRPQADLRPGRIVLDLSVGDFTIRPGPADEPLRVVADYDTSAFELEEELSQHADGWTYQLRFGGRGFLGFLGRNSSHNRLELIVPRGHPVDIVGEISLGESEVDLGGLWIGSVDLELGAGDHFIEFSEPPPMPLAAFELDSSVGSVEVRSLGVASPRRLQVDHGIGELFLDLQGDWRDDSWAEIEVGIGECRVWLPDAARVVFDRTTMGLGEKRVRYREEEDELPADAPTLHVSVSGGIGELDIE